MVRRAGCTLDRALRADGRVSRQCSTATSATAWITATLMGQASREKCITKLSGMKHYHDNNWKIAFENLSIMHDDGLQISSQSNSVREAERHVNFDIERETLNE